MIYLFLPNRLVNNANPTFAGNFKRALEDFDVNDVRKTSFLFDLDLI